MDQDEGTRHEAEEPSAPAKPMIKRRWAIMRSAGGGVAVIAVAGAIAFADPTDQGDQGDNPATGGGQVTAES
jgi:hypothetical protein